MKKLLKGVLPIAVLGLAVGIAIFLIKTGPEAKRRPPEPVIPVVEVMELAPTTYQVNVASRGTVVPRTQSTLVSEVAGRIIDVSVNYNNGGAFSLGEVLVQVDPAEYDLEVTNLEAGLREVQGRIAELAISKDNLQKSLAIERQQMALAEKQYQRNQRLRKQGTVSQSSTEESEREYLNRRISVQNLNNSLSLIPVKRQILESERDLKQAQLEQSQLNLQRTQIVAPYSGRVLKKSADLGQSLSRGTELATIYATDHVEVRLPITDQHADYLDLPGANNSRALPPVDVTFSTRFNGKRHQWQGVVLRSEGTVDTRTRQQFLVAQIDDPYLAGQDGRPALKVGQFLEARIAGRVLSDVFVLPRSAVRSNDMVLVVGPEERVERRQLQVIWRDQDSVVVGGGLKSGERISMTALPYTPTGAKVRLKGSEQASGRPAKPGQDAGKSQSNQLSSKGNG